MLVLTFTWGGTEVDYTKHLIAQSFRANEGLNTPATASFSITPIGRDFQVPPARAYVKLYSTVTEKSVYTGFVVTAPVRRYIAKASVAPVEQAGQLFQFDVQCMSDEHLLNIKSVPFVPAYVNRYQGQILSSLAEILCPGFFDTSTIQDGDLVPYFAYSPAQSFSEIVKLFGDGSRYRFKARDKQLWYTPYGDLPLGISYNEATQGNADIAPRDLRTDILSLPIVNDVTMIGDTEAGNNREDYFLGDGFTANFPLTHQVFQGASTLLLQESWNGNTLNTQQWSVLDPNTNFDFSGGALNVIDGLAPIDLGLSYLSLKNGIELAGGLDLQHGEFTFNDICEGIVGGIYLDETFAASGLVAGFLLSSPDGVVFGVSGAGPIPGPAIGVSGVMIQPMFMGVPIGDPVITDFNHNYVLQTVIHAPQYSRFTRKYRTLDGQEFGGVESEVVGGVTFVIQDYDIVAATGVYYTPRIVQSSVSGESLPAFAVYALVNNQQLNLTITNTTIAKMPLGGLSALTGPFGLERPSGSILPMLPPGSGGFIGPVLPWAAAASGAILPGPLLLGSVPQVQVLGNGYNLQAAQITDGQSADTLAFYLQSIPAAGTPIRLQTWEAQAAVSRLQVEQSIIDEAAVVGDDGIRSAIVTDLNPLPRTSEDCDNAALAFLEDRVGTYYNGTYTCTSLFLIALTSDLQYWPTVGRFFNINSRARGIDNQKYLVAGLAISILDLSTELLQFQIQFGADMNLEKTLRNFVDLQPVGVLAAKDKVQPVNPRYTQNVGSSYLPDLDSTFAESVDADNVYVRVYDGYLGPIEVRRIDSNWGGGNTPDYVGTFFAPTFVLPRKQFDQVWYMRPVQDGITSRRSKVLRVRYPMRPSAPAFISSTQISAPGPDGTLAKTFALQLSFQGDQRSIYGFELRAADNETVLVQKPALSLADLYVDLSQTSLLYLGDPLNNDYSLYAYFFNQQWEYSEDLVLDALLLPGTRLPYQWGPGFALPVSGDALYTAMGFGVGPAYENDAAGNPIATISISGMPPVAKASTLIGPPIISAQFTPVAGVLPGKYVIGVTAFDADPGLDTLYGTTPLSNLVTIEIPDSGGSIELTIEDWETEAFGGDVYIARVGDVTGFHLEATLTPGQATLSITSIAGSGPGAPDPLFHHFAIQFKKEIHGGIWAEQVQGVSGNMIAFTTQVFGINEYAGRVLTLLAHYDRSRETEIMNLAVVSNTVDTVTIGPNAAGVQPPDLTTLLQIGDVVMMRFKPIFRADGFTDPGLISSFNPLGLEPGAEKGNLAWVLLGTGAGQIKQIADNTEIDITLSDNWDIIPDESSIVVIVEAKWSSPFRTQPYKIPNRTVFNGSVAEPTTSNLANQTWIAQVITEDVDNQSGDPSLAPIREFFLFGEPGSGDDRLITARRP